METLEVFGIQWLQFEEDEWTEMRLYGISARGDRITAKFTGYPVQCLAQVINTHSSEIIRISDSELNTLVISEFQKSFPEDLLQSFITAKTIERSKFYYGCSKAKEQFIQLSFKTTKARGILLRHLKNKVKRLNNLAIDWLFYEDKESEVSTTRKMLIHRGLTPVGWFKFKGTSECTSKNPHSGLNHFEYRGDYKSLEMLQYNFYPPLRVLSFDLEVFSHKPRAFPSADNALDLIKIIGVAFKANNKTTYYSFVHGGCDPIRDTNHEPDPDKPPDLKTSEQKVEFDKEVEVIRFPDTPEGEVEMIEAFGRKIRELDPDLLLGYNIMGFDLPYLDLRLKRQLKDWIPIGRTQRKPVFHQYSWESSGYGRQNVFIPEIEGRLFIDMYNICRRDYKLPNYKLENVSQFFLKKGKMGMEAAELFAIFRSKDTKRMAEAVKYCTIDTDLVLELFEKLATWIDLIEQSKNAKIPVMDLFCRGQQIRAVSLAYEVLHNRGMVLDHSPSPARQIEGATVIQNSGFYSNLICLDFASMYPSIIIAFNISPDTFVPGDLAKRSVKDLQELNAKYHILKFTETTDKIYEREYYFLKEPVGVLPTVVKDQLQSRKETRELMKKETDELILTILNKRQGAKKIQANSIYGLMNVKEGGKMAFPEGASCVTGIGRKLLGMAKTHVESLGGKVAAGDTDSVMIDFGIKDGKKCHEMGDRLSREISALFPSPIGMAYEKTYGRFLQTSMKHYMAIPLDKNGELVPDDQIVRKGVISARRDYAKVSTFIHDDIALEILKGAQLDEIISRVESFVYGVMARNFKYTDFVMIKTLGQRYKSETYPLAVFSKRLRNAGVMVQGGDRLEFLLTTIGGVKGKQGDKMTMATEYIYNMRLDEIIQRDPVLRKQYAMEITGLPIDYRYYIEHGVMTPIQKLLAIRFKEELAGREKTVRVTKKNDLKTGITAEHIKTLLRLIDVKTQVMHQIRAVYLNCRRSPVKFVVRQFKYTPPEVMILDNSQVIRNSGLILNR